MVGMPLYACSSLLSSPVQLIMPAGQRLEEIARLYVDQWDAAETIVDWSKTENFQPHAVPLPTIAAELTGSTKQNK